MRQMLLHAYATRLIFLIVAGVIAGVILQIHALAAVPSRVRRSFH